MADKEEIEKYTHYIMCVVGGFLGAYALLNHHEIFGSSQTSNMIYMIMNLLGRNAGEFLLRCFALIIYMSGIALTVFLAKRTKANLQVVSIILDIVAVSILGFLPKGLNDFVALYPIFFITAVQWNSFQGAHGFVSSSIFSTNNIRQTVISFTEYLLDKDKSQLLKMKFYTGVLLSYHIGAAISYLSYIEFGIKGAWVCFVPLMIALLIKFRTLLYREKVLHIVK